MERNKIFNSLLLNISGGMERTGKGKLWHSTIEAPQAIPAAEADRALSVADQCVLVKKNKLVVLKTSLSPF